ncbi:MAG: diacylglycerol kinase family protein [Candidatus Dormiibacterota bacterium]
MNPARVRSQAGLRKSIVRALAEEGWPEPLWLQTDREDAGESAARRAVAVGAEVLFVCGGDGTVMAAAAALAGTQTALAVIPSGTGNLLALNLRLPADVMSAVRVATRGDRRNIDLGEVDGRLFAVAAGIGLDAQILAETPRRAKHRLGWPAYAAAALRHLGGPRFPAKVSLDGGTPIEREVRSVLVANVGRLPGGINLLPGAVADDGLLDVALIAPRRLHDWARLLTSLMGRHPTGGRLETFRARRVDITTPEPQPREMDGESLPPGEVLAVRIRPHALTVCVGRKLPTSR